MLAAHSLESQSHIHTPKAEEVSSYLGELLGRAAFNASERNRRFLSYVVKETLDGRADRIKAYNIALAAFDRTEDFDPLTDPIVRIEAGRLRRSLEHYYLTSGQADRIRIGIPKGSYAATFAYREDASGEPHEEAQPCSVEVPIVLPRYAVPARHDWRTLTVVVAALGLIVGSLSTFGIMRYADQAAPAAATSDYPSLVIMPFEDVGGDPNSSFVARGLTYDVGTALMQLRDVAVFGQDRGVDDEVPGPAAGSDFTLMGSVQVARHNMRVAVFLMDSRTGQFLQSWSFQKDLISQDLIRAQQEVAHQILSSLKQACTHVADRRPSEIGEGSFDCRPVSLAAR
jgi:adenylate cyclase